MGVYEFDFGLFGLQIGFIGLPQRIDYYDPSKGCVQPLAYFYYSCRRRRVVGLHGFILISFGGRGGGGRNYPIRYGRLNNILLTLTGRMSFLKDSGRGG